MCEPSETDAEFHVVVYVFGDEVDVISEPMSVVLSSMNCTPATATLSEAVEVRVTVPEIVPVDGEVRVIEGGVASGAIVNVCVVYPPV